MKRTLHSIFIIILLYPWIVGFSTEGNKTITLIDFVFGIGKYTDVVKDYVPLPGPGCNSAEIVTQNDYAHSDYGIKLRRQYENSHFMIYAGGMSSHRDSKITSGAEYAGNRPMSESKDGSSLVVGAALGMDGDYFGVTGGVKFIPNAKDVQTITPLDEGALIFGFRMGYLQTYHFRLEINTANNHLTGNYLDIGFLFPFDSSSFWAGFGVDRHQQLPQLTLRTDLRISNSPLVIKGECDIPFSKDDPISKSDLD